MKRIVVLAIAATSLCGCGNILHGVLGPDFKGSGRLKTETRNVSEFHKIVIGGSTEAEVRVGPKASLEITADDNLLSHIRTRVEDGALVIDHEGSFSSEHQTRAVITVPSLTAIEISGAGQINVKDVHSKELSVELSGASRITATGTADEINLSASGASKADFSSLSAKKATVDGTGASKLTVNASGEISGDLSGASHLRYSGHPQVHVDTSGASSVGGG